jgi:hypothetical protein
MAKAGSGSADAVVVPRISDEKLRLLGEVDPVRRSVNRAKQAKLSRMLEASEAEGGAYSAEEVRRLVREHLARAKVETP